MAWSGLELSHLPEGIVEAFRTLVAGWEIRQCTPDQMKQARMVTLAKPGKVQQGVLQVADTRPLTILSCWWRIYQSACIADPAFRTWVPNSIPHNICGRRGFAVAAIIGKVLEDFSEQGYVMSMDWSKCFDTLACAPSCSLMEDWGPARSMGTCVRVCLDQPRTLGSVEWRYAQCTAENNQQNPARRSAWTLHMYALDGLWLSST